MPFFELDDVFGYQDANAIKKLWPGDTPPVAPGDGEVWLDTSGNPPLLKRYLGSDQWEIINGASLQVAPNGDCIDIQGTDLNNLQGTGFFMGSSLTNSPDGTTAWFYILQMQHATNFKAQLAWNVPDNTQASQYMRIMNSDVWGNWYKIWSETSDGTDSGLNADYLDGLNSSQFVRSDADDTVNGDLSWPDTKGIKMGNDSDLTLSHDGSHAYIVNNTGNMYLKPLDQGKSLVVTMKDSEGTAHDYLIVDPASYRLSFGADQGFKLYNSGEATQLQTHNSPLTIRSFVDGANISFVLDDATATAKNMMSLDPDAEIVYIMGNQAWHAGNHGSGSGLDADLLDGNDSGNFLMTDNGINLDIRQTDLDNLDGAGFYKGYELGNAPGGSTGWFYIMHFQHNYNYKFQFAFNLTGVSPSSLFIRILNDTVWSPWYKVWTEVNDGSGSGLDADKLDGVEGSGYVNTTNTQSVAGAKTFTGSVNVNEKLVIPLDQPSSLENGCIWIT